MNRGTLVINVCTGNMGMTPAQVADWWIDGCAMDVLLASPDACAAHRVKAGCLDDPDIHPIAIPGWRRGLLSHWAGYAIATQRTGAGGFLDRMSGHDWSWVVMALGMELPHMTKRLGYFADVCGVNAHFAPQKPTLKQSVMAMSGYLWAVERGHTLPMSRGIQRAAGRHTLKAFEGLDDELRADDKSGPLVVQF